MTLNYCLAHGQDAISYLRCDHGSVVASERQWAGHSHVGSHLTYDTHLSSIVYNYHDDVIDFFFAEK